MIVHAYKELCIKNFLERFNFFGVEALIRGNLEIPQ
jgi:hypothetical protein